MSKKSVKPEVKEEVQKNNIQVIVDGKVVFETLIKGEATIEASKHQKVGVKKIEVLNHISQHITLFSKKPHEKNYRITTAKYVDNRQKSKVKEVTPALEE